MENLQNLITNANIQLIIWDFDGVIADLEWNYGTTVDELLREIYEEINTIDPEIIKDKDEFIRGQFPFPEINLLGAKYGKEKQARAKKILQEKEVSSLEFAKPNEEIISLI